MGLTPTVERRWQQKIETLTPLIASKRSQVEELESQQDQAELELEDLEDQLSEARAKLEEEEGYF